MLYLLRLRNIKANLFFSRYFYISTQRLRIIDQYILNYLEYAVNIIPIKNIFNPSWESPKSVKTRKHVCSKKKKKRKALTSSILISTTISAYHLILEEASCWYKIKFPPKPFQIPSNTEYRINSKPKPFLPFSTAASPFLQPSNWLQNEWKKRKRKRYKTERRQRASITDHHPSGARYPIPCDYPPSLLPRLPKSRSVKKYRIIHGRPIESDQLQTSAERNASIVPPPSSSSSSPTTKQFHYFPPLFSSRAISVIIVLRRFSIDRTNVRSTDRTNGSTPSASIVARPSKRVPCVG